MYISSDGTEKNLKEMNYEYLVNALAKRMRDIFNSTSMKDYEKYVDNIENLTNEIFERINQFVDTNGKEWE